MADAVESAYDAMIANLYSAHSGELSEVSNAYNAEDRINNLRNNLRDAEIENIVTTPLNFSIWDNLYLDFAQNIPHSHFFGLFRNLSYLRVKFENNLIRRYK